MHIQQVAVLKTLVDALGGGAAGGLRHEVAHSAKAPGPVDEAGVALPVGGLVAREHARLPVGVQQIEQVSPTLAQRRWPARRGALAQQQLGVDQVRLDAQRIRGAGGGAPPEAGHVAGVAHHGVDWRQRYRLSRPAGAHQPGRQPDQPH